MKYTILIIATFLSTSCSGSPRLNKQPQNDTVSIHCNDSLAYIYTIDGNAKDDAGDKQGAIADYTKAIEICPNYVIAYFNRAIVKSILGDTKGSIADYTKALEIDPNKSEAYYGRALAKDKQGDTKAAITDYSKAIELNPNDVDAYLNRGNLRAQSGDTKGALADYTRVIVLDPDDTSAYLNRSVAKYESGDHEGALADCRLAIKNCEPRADIYNNYGRFLYDLKRFRESAAAYGEGIGHFPEDYRLYYGRGLARNQSGDKKGACRDWLTSSELGCFEANALLPLCEDCETESDGG